MADIFHYNEPQSAAHWKRKTTSKNPIGRILQLKHEIISSYKFYHYKYQKEKPGDGDKYGIIGIHVNLLFFYMEEPEILEKAFHLVKLMSSNTPANWSELMEEHFSNWENMPKQEQYWRNIETIIFI